MVKNVHMDVLLMSQYMAFLILIYVSSEYRGTTGYAETENLCKLALALAAS